MESSRGTRWELCIGTPCSAITFLLCHPFLESFEVCCPFTSLPQFEVCRLVLNCHKNPAESPSPHSTDRKRETAVIAMHKEERKGEQRTVHVLTHREEDKQSTKHCRRKNNGNPNCNGIRSIWTPHRHVCVRLEKKASVHEQTRRQMFTRWYILLKFHIFIVMALFLKGR